MPPLRLTSVLQTALPDLSENGRAFLNVLGCLNGHAPCSRELAQWLGFHDRYQLARSLRRDGLPPLEIIGGWARTLYWVLEAETTGLSLRELAERERLDPAVAYRLVRRVTGLRWSEVRGIGLAGALLRFRERCGARRALVRPATLIMAAPTRVSSAGFRPEGGGRVPQAAAARAVVPGHRVIQSVHERVPVTGSPFDVMWTPFGGALVTRPHASAVDMLLVDPLRVAHTIRVRPVPTRVVMHARSRHAFVTSQFTESICIIDVERRLQIGTIPVPGHALAAALSPDGAILFTTTNRDRLVAVSPVHRSVLGTTELPLVCPQVTTHPSGRWVFVPCWRAGLIVEVDARTFEITRRFEVGGIPQDLIVSADGQTLYAANEGGWLDVIHLASGRRTVTVTLGTPAMGIALSRDQSHLFVGLLNAGRVVVLQRNGLIERATITTGGRPRLIAPHPDGDVVLVANEAGWVDLLR